MLDIIIIQFVLGLLLFFIVNWIGKHSYSVGYISISIFMKIDEAPAFNFIVRTLTPVVYLLLSASFLYLLNLDKYVYSFYMVSLYYILIRLVVNLLTGRILLLNWPKQILYWTVIMILSYYAHNRIIVTKSNLVPDFTTLANELWIIIFVFVYHIFNKIRTSDEGTIKRKQNYLNFKFKDFRKKYGSIISTLENNRLIALAYSILIYENFNRPYVIRLIENMNFKITKKPHTLGIMQVQSENIISDEQSIKMGVNKIKKDYLYLVNNPKERFIEMKNDPEYDDEMINCTVEYNLQKDVIELYNGGSEYKQGIEELMDIIEAEFFNTNQDKLMDGLKADWYVTKSENS